MTRIVLLDSGPLGAITNPKRSPKNLACARWFQSLRQYRHRVIIPEICDYELRRELIRADKQPGLQRLDELIERTEYLPIHTAAMRRAALFWAEARKRGMPTADDKSLDADMILAGQAASLGESDVVIATTNVGHLSRFVPAEEWHKIQPE